MDVNKYVNQLPYPEKPKKPFLPCAPKSTNPYDFEDYILLVQEHVQNLKEYLKLLEDYSNLRHKYDEEGDRLYGQFKADALEEVGLTGHPKAEKAWEKAWSEGSSNGYSEVLSHLCDYAELILN